MGYPEAAGLRSPERPRDVALEHEHALDLGCAVSVKDRVRQALVCPYCRDDVTRSAESVLCARDACGALYHSECWDECRSFHGSCAVFGCDSTEAGEVSSLGYLLRLLSLLVTAILLPPRVVHAVHELEDEGVAGIYHRARALAQPFFLSVCEPAENSALKLFLYVSAALPLAGLGTYLIPLLDPTLQIGGFLLMPILVLLATFLGPSLIAFGATLACCVAWSLARALRSELAALGLLGRPDAEATAAKK